jgi:uncharacterized membrane protein YoaK (UPF0700 family)
MAAPPSAPVRDLLLVGLTVSSGAVDAISYLALGKIFTAFMTGNLVFLGLRVAREGTSNVTHASVALAAFAVGVVLAQQIVKTSGSAPAGAALWPRRVSVALAVALVAQAGFLAAWLATSGRPSGGTGVLLVGLSALAMGIQSGAVRALGVSAVFTTAATATLIVLASDLGAWTQSATELRRLAGVIVGLLAGAAFGAVLLVHARPYAAVLPLVISALVVATACVAFGTRTGLPAAPAHRPAGSEGGGLS